MADGNFDPFAPLTDGEISAASRSAARKPEPDDGELVSPVPPDAPKPPQAHSKLGEPAARWTYRNAKGDPLAHVLRFDRPGKRKEFSWLTLWRNAKGLLWRWKALPEQRPLYGLDKLAARELA